MTTRPKSLVGETKDIDRRIRGIGRIRVRSGLPDGPQWRAMNDMVTQLARDEEGRTLLREVFAKRLQIDVLWTHYKLRSLHLIPLGTAAAGLVDALETWREQTKRDVSADTYRVRRELVEAVRDQVKHWSSASGGGIVANLPDYVRVLRVQMKGARSFNLLRAYALAFVRDTLGKQSSVYAAVQAVPVRKVRAKVRPRPLSPFELTALRMAWGSLQLKWGIDHPSAKATKRPKGQIADAYCMCLTGMNPLEYAGTWIAARDRVRISGTKRGGRVRDVPKAFPNALWPQDRLAPPSASPKVWGKALHAAAKIAGIPCTPYDMRRTFANWMESAGIPRTRRRLYMGHGAADITDLYERHEVDAFLVEDGAKLRDWINTQVAQTSTEAPAFLTILPRGRATAQA